MNTIDLILDENFRSWVLNPSPEGTLYWERWIEENQIDEFIVLQAREIILGFKFIDPTIRYSTQEKILNSILDRQKKEREVSGTSLSRFNRFYNSITKIAAVFVLGIGVLFLWHLTNQEDTFHPAIEVLSNPIGVKSKIRLVDGTKVWLNADSEITYAKGLADTSRWVKLEGEAYFEVAKNSKPFVVKIGRLSIKALGTAFDINGFDQKNIRVYLTEGKVQLKQNIGEISVAPMLLDSGEMALVKDDQAQIINSSFTLDEALGWTENEIVFNKASFQQVLESLKRWYGVEFKVENSDIKPTWSYTSKFKNQSLEEVLQIISETEKFTYKTDGEIVILFIP